VVIVGEMRGSEAFSVCASAGNCVCAVVHVSGAALPPQPPAGRWQHRRGVAVEYRRRPKAKAGTA